MWPFSSRIASQLNKLRPWAENSGLWTEIACPCIRWKISQQLNFFISQPLKRNVQSLHSWNSNQCKQEIHYITFLFHSINQSAFFRGFPATLQGLSGLHFVVLTTSLKKTSSKCLENKTCQVVCKVHRDHLCCLCHSFLQWFELTCQRSCELGVLGLAGTAD